MMHDADDAGGDMILVPDVMEARVPYSDIGRPRTPPSAPPMVEGPQQLVPYDPNWVCPKCGSELGAVEVVLHEDKSRTDFTQWLSARCACGYIEYMETRDAHDDSQFTPKLRVGLPVYVVGLKVTGKIESMDETYVYITPGFGAGTLGFVPKRLRVDRRVPA